MENKEPVETKPEGAGTPGVPEEADLLNEFQAVLEENDKLRRDRDNYRKIGLAKKKGEVPPEPTMDEEEVERRAEERAKELMQTRQSEENEKKQREIALKALKENRELKIALKNRSGIVTTPTSGSHADPAAPKDTFWTADQLAYFKKRGLNPDKVKENYLKVKG